MVDMRAHQSELMKVVWKVYCLKLKLARLMAVEWVVYLVLLKVSVLGQ